MTRRRLTVNGGSWNNAFNNGLKGAAAGAIMGGIAGGFGNRWNVGRVMLTSMGGGVSSEIMGGDFADGFKVALITSAAAYAYNAVSSKYNTNGGKPHIGQNGRSDVGKRLPTDYWDKIKNPKHFDIYGNKIIPGTSDQSAFMKWVGKNVFYGDAFAEAHDGFHDLPYVPGDQLSLVVTMPPAYALTIVAAYDPYSFSYLISEDVNKDNK